MPREDRLIIFDYVEVYKAIYSLCSQKNLKKPMGGAVEDICLTGDTDTQVILTIVNEASGDRKQETYKRDFLAAALMLYCRGLGIPLPKKADKAVMLNDGEVTLRVKIGRSIV